MTWQAFEQLPDGDGWHREVVEGELIVLPPPKSKHTIIANAVATALRPLESDGTWKVLVEAGYRLSNDPPTGFNQMCRYSAANAPARPAEMIIS
jgi:hypothetical protein